jgi:hypothetical protein
MRKTRFLSLIEQSLKNQKDQNEFSHCLGIQDNCEEKIVFKEIKNDPNAYLQRFHQRFQTLSNK